MPSRRPTADRPPRPIHFIGRKDRVVIGREDRVADQQATQWRASALVKENPHACTREVSRLKASLGVVEHGQRLFPAYPGKPFQEFVDGGESLCAACSMDVAMGHVAPSRHLVLLELHRCRPARWYAAR
jgi:hypothetical protein